MKGIKQLMGVAVAAALGLTACEPIDLDDGGGGTAGGVFNSGFAFVRGDRNIYVADDQGDPNSPTALTTDGRAQQPAVSRYGRFAELRLYILGHTDTVGDTDSNRKLSLERARSIAAYLRKRGLKLPIFYEGFGEQAPSVATPDETAEAANRRAEYILAVEPPALASTPFPPQWRKL